MHIPDGFVNVPVALSTGVLAAAAFTYAVKRVGKVLPPSRTALLGVSAAFIFAAQMLNFPVAGGTSGHLVGGTLAAVLLGPSASIIAMFAVVVLQCFLFADGGVTALGANVFNMAVLAPLVGYAVYRVVMPVVRMHHALAAGIAGWFSTMVASLACAGQIALSGKAAPGLIFPAMAGAHVFIGIGEGLITAMVIAGIARTRRELLDPVSAQGAEARSYWPVLVFGTVLSLGLAMFVAPFASPLPDGLEHVAETLGFHTAALEPLVPGVAPDYAVPGVESEGLSTALAGVIGTVLVLGLLLLLSRVIVRGQGAQQPAKVPAGDTL